MTAVLAPPVDGPAPVIDPPQAAEPRWSRRVGFGLLGVLIAAFVGSGWWRFTAPFGDNHDGSNGGVWVDLARGLVDNGPIASRLGSRPFTGDVYAHHPPLITWITAAADWVGRDNPFVYRLPVILGALATIALLVVLLRDLGLRWLAIGLGLGLALGTPLFFVYGPMIDTLPLSFPFGIALLVLWNRRAAGTRAAAGLLGLTAALCVLSSWEAALLVGVTYFASLLLGRRDTLRLRHLAPVFVGAAIGATVLVAWLLWASGSFGPLLDQLRQRSGTQSLELGFVDSLRRQWAILGHGLGPVRWLLLPAAVVGIANRKTRLVMLVLVPTALAYPILLSEAAVHDFWNLWFVAPLAIGIAAAGDWIATRARTGAAQAVVAAVACIAVLTSLAFTALDDPEPSQHFRLGLAATRAIDAADLDGPILYTFLPRGLNTNWLELRTGSEVQSVESQAALIMTVLNHPDAPVLIDCDQLPGSFRRACRGRSPDPGAEFGAAYAVVPIEWITRQG